MAKAHISYRVFLPLLFAALLSAVAVQADHGPQTAKAMSSVIVVEPIWPGYTRPGFGAPPGTAPAGSGVFFGAKPVSRYIITAAHVVRRATRIEIVDSGGYRHHAELFAIDEARDIAVLKSDFAVQPITVRSDTPMVGEHACAVGNSFGLGLSLTCGVVSATRRKNVGFNAIEDFIQTDAAINPGASGGALVDANGRLVGLIDGIFTKEADIDAGVNFAISIQLISDALDRMRSRHPELPSLQ